MTQSLVRSARSRPEDFVAGAAQAVITNDRETPAKS